MSTEGIAKAVIAAAAGTFIGWAGSALTLTGRVDAIERTLQRIESRMDDAAIQRTAPKAKHAAPDPEAR